MIHPANPKCDDCGARHAPGNPAECVGVLMADIVILQAELAGLENQEALADAQSTAE